MGLFYRREECFRIRVSFENQNIMMRHIDVSYSPLFTLKRDQFYLLKFENKVFTCTCLKTKQRFVYKDIQKIETKEEGVVIYLNDNHYIAIAAEHTERHNTELYDIVIFLKHRCRFRFHGKTKISYPEDENEERYSSKKAPSMQMSYSLTDRELKWLVWYEFLFSDHNIIFIIGAVISILIAFLFRGAWLLVPIVAIVAFFVIFGKSLLEEIEGYTQNHQGLLQMLLYDSLLIVRLRSADLELKYCSMKEVQTFLGLWHLNCGPFFTLVLPARLVKENPEFFAALYAKMKKS